MNTQQLLAIVAFTLVFSAAISLFKWARSSLRSIPGPTLAHFTDAWYFFRLKQGDFEKVNVSLHKEYGTYLH